MVATWWLVSRFSVCLDLFILTLFWIWVFGLWVRFDCFCVFIYLECFLGFELAVYVCFVILVWRFAFLLLLW